MNIEQNPKNTICVIKHAGKEVGRIPATAPNAEAYISELVKYYGNCEVIYEKDKNAWLLAALHR